MTYITNAWEMFQFMNARNTLMAFTGNIDHHVTTSLLKNFKNKVGAEGAETEVDKKVYSVLVESMENISKHSSQENRSILLLNKTEEAYVVIAGNPIENKDIPLLKEKLEKFSKLDNSQLKKIYREQLLSRDNSENSAGLGMIDIAIKSGNNIEYLFHPLTSLMSFYILQIKINI
jgi:hypothetical protein